MDLEFNALTTEWCYAWDKRWNPSTGVANVDHVLDIRDVQIAAGSAFEAIPAIQYAGVRTDRPDAGVAYRLTAGTKVSAQARLYTAFRSCETIFPAREIVFNPQQQREPRELLPTHRSLRCQRGRQGEGRDHRNGQPQLHPPLHGVTRWLVRNRGDGAPSPGPPRSLRSYSGARGTRHGTSAWR